LVAVVDFVVVAVMVVMVVVDVLVAAMLVAMVLLMVVAVVAAVVMLGLVAVVVSDMLVAATTSSSTCGSTSSSASASGSTGGSTSTSASTSSFSSLGAVFCSYSFGGFLGFSRGIGLIILFILSISSICCILRCFIVGGFLFLSFVTACGGISSWTVTWSISVSLIGGIIRSLLVIFHVGD